MHFALVSRIVSDPSLYEVAAAGELEPAPAAASAR
jgi:hypothetical protein